MKFSPDDKTRHPVVQEKYRCVWMTAGILSYQLCDRQFDCDRCPLDDAMRMHFSPGNARMQTAQAREQSADSSMNLSSYSPNHCWVREVEEGFVRIGVEPGFASKLVTPKAVALPSIGEEVKQRQVCCWIVLEGGTIPLVSPVTGTVTATNARITEVPHELHAHPLTDGWLFAVKIDSPISVQGGLMSRQDVERVYATDAAHFNDLLIGALKGNSRSVGATLQDGGQALQDVSAMLGPKRYFEILREVYGTMKP